MYNIIFNIPKIQIASHRIFAKDDIGLTFYVFTSYRSWPVEIFTLDLIYFIFIKENGILFLYFLLPSPDPKIKWPLQATCICMWRIVLYSDKFSNSHYAFGCIFFNPFSLYISFYILFSLLWQHFYFYYFLQPS